MGCCFILRWEKTSSVFGSFEVEERNSGNSLSFEVFDLGYSSSLVRFEGFSCSCLLLGHLEQDLNQGINR